MENNDIGFRAAMVPHFLASGIEKGEYHPKTGIPNMTDISKNQIVCFLTGVI